jgi:hypothetical protein
MSRLRHLVIDSCTCLLCGRLAVLGGLEVPSRRTHWESLYLAEIERPACGLDFSLFFNF